MSLRELPIKAGTMSDHLGRQAVRFAERTATLVEIADVQLTNGTVQVDLALTGERGFPGIAFRVNGDSYESFFVRPHQSGNPDSVQYTPVFNDVSGWQLYTGSGYWASVELPMERWFRLRVCFAGDRAEAYIDDMETPALVFRSLRMQVAAGGIGILASPEGVHYSRLSYDPAAPVLRGAPPPVEELVPGTVPGWSVSNLVAEGVAPAAARNWTYLAAEASGLANLARVHPLGTTLNTVFARATLVAQSAGIRPMDLGFSDRAVVYLNGRPLFAGRDDYRSRDYRFLGSIGYWDTVFLPLEQGANELIVAVSESFGGWGVQARFTDATGITFKP